VFLSNKVLYTFVALNTALVVVNLFMLENPSAALFNFLCACLIWVGIIGKDKNGNK